MSFNVENRKIRSNVGQLSKIIAPHSSEHGTVSTGVPLCTQHNRIAVKVTIKSKTQFRSVVTAASSATNRRRIGQEMTDVDVKDAWQS